MKIVMTEKKDALQRLYRDEFEEEGYEVLIAATSTEAAELLGSEKDSVVTLDMEHSGTTETITAVSRLRQVAPFVPIIILTAFDYRDDFARLEVDGFVLKSADLTELKRTVQKVSGAPNRVAGERNATCRQRDNHQEPVLSAPTPLC